MLRLVTIVSVNLFSGYGRAVRGGGAVTDYAYLWVEIEMADSKTESCLFYY